VHADDADDVLNIPNGAAWIADSSSADMFSTSADIFSEIGIADDEAAAAAAAAAAEIAGAGDSGAEK
jgi:hypothetical protein